MLELIISLRVVGTILLAIKLVGIERNKIIKKCIGQSLIIDEEKNVYIIKEHYLEMLKENIYATVGIVYIIIGEIMNLFLTNNITRNEQIKIIAITIIIAVILYILSDLSVKGILKCVDKKENKMIKLDNKIIEEGAVAVQIFDE